METLARRGYRFVAPLERIDGDRELPEREPTLPAESGNGRVKILATAEELPKVSYPVAQTLFVLLQLMYVGFYVGALANLAEIEDLFSPLAHARALVVVLIATAAALIPARAFVVSAFLLHAPRAREKFFWLWRFLLPLDVLWALSPFLLLHHINLGLALACTALLVYSPFAQRSLVLMGAGGTRREVSASAVLK
ncbi:MAG: hypothetical protein ACRD3F_15725 [Acidobacteriaceae bacterium]